MRKQVDQQIERHTNQALLGFWGAPFFKKAVLGLIFLCTASVLLGACASRQRVPSASALPLALSESPPEGEDNRFWWEARFKIVWPSDHAPDSAVDLLLAHAVIEPLLKDHAKHLLRWRFHRRAAPDSTGHQFTFFFYTNTDTAAELFKKIKENDHLIQALSAQIVEKVILDNPDKPSRPQIEDTSDPQWSPSLQKNWPSYIMGVSALWLGLIDDEMTQVSHLPGMEISQQLETYRKAEIRITKSWNREGQHAFLHHLSAVFGYEPLLIRKNILF
ncbi:MAG: hypothetical protein ABGX83_04745 [Nitrospira sp.]|jgi:hypothetical protein|nr:hypothetical protein [Candidatus Manganitrophaceae bacterium]HIL35694.1 hypothetical protein [Candidatus Manganitrophaceae bacterium]